MEICFLPSFLRERRSPTKLWPAELISSVIGFFPLSPSGGNVAREKEGRRGRRNRREERNQGDPE